MKICIDFDGTCVTHEYPETGKDIGAERVLRRLLERGHDLILFTMRSGEELDNAIRWFKAGKISLYGINVNPEQEGWTSSPKAYGQLYIDDLALGCPLIMSDKSERPYVDWEAVEEILMDGGILERQARPRDLIDGLNQPQFRNSINHGREDKRRKKK